MNWSKVVAPVKTGVQYFCNASKYLDSGVHRNDDFGNRGDALPVIFGNQDDILSSIKGKQEELT
jgi:hypothetical protein